MEIVVYSFWRSWVLSNDVLLIVPGVGGGLDGHVVVDSASILPISHVLHVLPIYAKSCMLSEGNAHIVHIDVAASSTENACSTETSSSSSPPSSPLSQSSLASTLRASTMR